jgi:CheY-like chemotaxis protein
MTQPPVCACPDRRGKQILIVDDDDGIRGGLALVLRAAGHGVRTAANGRQALEALRQRRADLVLLDLVMPVLDGWGFRVEQMLDPGLADIPVIVLSAEGDSAEEARLLGIDRCFAKPANAYETLELVGDLFDVVESCPAV